MLQFHKLSFKIADQLYLKAYFTQYFILTQDTEIEKFLQRNFHD